MPRAARLLLFALSLLPAVAAQPAVRADTLALDAVVVTATRTERALEDVAVPTTVIGAAAIEAQGAVRLSDVLETVPGLFLFDDHGSGLQVQGFAPDYTLILIDGEPVVGRTAGTLDLDRLSVAGVERVEVVRGPTSSLYGSDALAGVVNVVTSRPREGVSGQARLRGGSFGTTDATLALGLGRGGDAAGAWAVRVLANRFASGGYDLTPDAFGPTAPSFADWTGDVRARVALGRGAVLRLGARAAVQDQEGAFALAGADGETAYDDTGERTDWSVHPAVEVPLSGRLRLTASLYGARYAAGVRQREAATGALYYADDFDQRFAKAETQFDAYWNARHATTWGVGVSDERLAGDRYGSDVAPSAQQAFAFAQHIWAPSRAVEIAASARADAHTAYAARVTPKVSALVRAAEGVRLRASVGSGFKAPAFRQLFLAFSNAAAGYSVFGSERLADGLAALVAEGQIAQVLLDPAALGAIRAENSVSVQAGGSVAIGRTLTLDAGVFHNSVRDLIETQPVAQKTNGQFVYGYFNVDRIYTRGLDAQATWRPGVLDLAVGYQFLQARDRSVVDALAEGSVFGRDPDGREYRLTPADYGGLFGRSPHAVTLRAGLAAGGWTGSARARWRSRYGYRDLDGNGVANRSDEFVPAYAVIDLTLTRSWTRVAPVVGASRVTLQAGVDNLFGITRPTLVPSLPGRALYASVGLSF